MQVKYGLSGTGTVIDIQPVGITDPLIHGNVIRLQQHVTQQQPVVLCRIGQHRDRLFRDDKYMNGGLGVDVPEGEAQVIFVDDIGRDLTIDNLAE